MKCQNCGYEVSEDELFCGNCGQKVQQQNRAVDSVEYIFCGECGAKNSSGTKFCPECGNPLVNQGVNENREMSSNKSKGLIIVIICIVAVIIALSIVLIHMMTPFSEKNDGVPDTDNTVMDVAANKNNRIDGSLNIEERNNNSDENTQEDIREDSTEGNDDLNDVIMNEDKLGNSESIIERDSHTYEPPEFTSVEASSMLGMSATGNEYYPSYVLDNDLSTCWASNPNEGHNPSITLRADSTQLISGILFSNGYFKSEKTYNNNRRITKIQISYEGGYAVYNCEPEQYLIMQDVKFDEPIETSFITVKVLNSEAGTEGWDDICISTIEVY